MAFIKVIWSSQRCRCQGQNTWQVHGNGRGEWKWECYGTCKMRPLHYKIRYNPHREDYKIATTTKTKDIFLILKRR